MKQTWVLPRSHLQQGGGGVLPSPIRQPEFESAMVFYTPTGATGALRSLGLQLIDSPASNVSVEDSRSVVCALNFMEEDEFAMPADETVSMGSTDSNMLS